MLRRECPRCTRLGRHALLGQLAPGVLVLVEIEAHRAQHMRRLGKLDIGISDHLDPFARGVEVVEYSNIQFTKAPHELRAMGFDLDKNENAQRELAEKGMAP